MGPREPPGMFTDKSPLCRSSYVSKYTLLLLGGGHTHVFVGVAKRDGEVGNRPNVTRSLPTPPKGFITI